MDQRKGGWVLMKEDGWRGWLTLDSIIPRVWRRTPGRQRNQGAPRVRAHNGENYGSVYECGEGVCSDACVSGEVC